MNANGSAHCDESGCHQLDFLPFACDACRGTFCLEHRDPAHHSCSLDVTRTKLMPECPVCGQYVYVKASENVDTIVSQHIQSRCRSHRMSEILAIVKARQSLALRCERGGCSNKESYSTMQCTQCRRQFCLSHRFPQQHECVGRPQSSTTNTHATTAAKPDPHAKGKAVIEKLRREREAKEAAKRKAQPTTLQMVRAQMAAIGTHAANAVNGVTSAIGLTQPTQSPSQPSDSFAPPSTANLREVKRLAKGDESVLAEDRIHLRVAGSAVRANAEPHCVWLNRKWTVGRATDAITDILRVKNENHMHNATHRVTLCAASTGKPLPSDIPLQLLAPIVQNGGSVKLERIERAPSPQPPALTPS